MIQKKLNINFNVNSFLKNIKFKKQYLKKVKQKITLLENNRKINYKQFKMSKYNKEKFNFKEDFLITYVIDITFSQTNTLLHVMDPSGKIKFFCSAGTFTHSGKSKKTRFNVFKDIYKFLISKLKFAKNKPLALHLKNVGSNKFWIIKKLKKKFFIKIVRNFNYYPYNGCRKPKAIRKKIKRRNGRVV